MTPPLLELGGAGPALHLAPANGFPPETYRPALEPLAASHRLVSLPPRALWPDAGPPPVEAGSWAGLADDLLAGLAAHRLDRVIGVGHSFGAVATLLAAVREPARFRALALLDPTILPPAYMEGLRAQRARGEPSFRPLVQGALKRRDRFASVEEGFAYWREKPLFRDWSDGALRRYAEAMLRPAGDGAGFTLAWPAAWEAWYYMSFHTESWEALARLDPGIPLLVVHGGSSDTFVPEVAALLQERVPRARLVELPGRGHLFPQAAPEETGRVLREWLAEAAAPGG